MSVIAKIRRGEGPFWGGCKGAARRVLSFHVPVVPLTRPLFRFLYAVHVTLRESLLWALRFFWYEPLFRGQCETVGEGLRMEQLPYMTGKGRIVLGRRVRLSGKSSIGFSNCIRLGPELVIGDDTFIGHGCAFNIGSSVRVGRHCLLASGVKVYDLDGHPADAALRREGRPGSHDSVRPVLIGDDVWVGTGAVILKGVRVGDRSIVGAGAVVTRDVPPDVVVAGNPARVVKHLSPPDRG